VKRLLALSALLLVATAPAAWADHHEQLDGCDHGATSVPCRPDPSPNGKDCDSHGNHGGINEDHCTEETTTSTDVRFPGAVPDHDSVPSTTSTSTPAPSGTTTTTATPTTTTASAPITATPTTTATPSTTTTSTELPMTGAATTTLLFAGAWLILSGLAAMLIGATLKGAAVASEPGGGAGEATAAGPEYHDGTRGETL
jgi:hypothetical protein